MRRSLVLMLLLLFYHTWGINLISKILEKTTLIWKIKVWHRDWHNFESSMVDGEPSGHKITLNHLGLPPASLGKVPVYGWAQGHRPAPLWHHCGISVASVWHQYGTSMAPLWGQSGVNGALVLEWMVLKSLVWSAIQSGSECYSALCRVLYNMV